jgi:type III pantothenate kinase
MILVIDVGNTRLKWAWLTSTGLSDQQAVVHRDAKPGMWTAALFESGQIPSRVLVSNVAGAGMAKMLIRQSQKLFGVEVEFITATPEFHGLINGYLDPKLLGADRWLALIGAWTRTRSSLCVVDVGTSVKVDSVDAAGHHLGGLIVPGIHMMREALMNQTSDIAKAAEHSTPSLAGVLANNTIGAVSRGAVFALAGLADRSAEIIEQSTGAKPKLYITGGDAGMITGTMRARGEIVPDLVLQGLAVIAAQAQEPIS